MLWLPGAAEMVERATGGRLFEAQAWELPASLLAVGAAALALAGLARGGRLLSMAVPEGLGTFLGSWFGLPALARRVVVDPVLSLSHTLASFDDRVIDAGVRAAARVPVMLSRAASWWGERSLDGVVAAVSGGTLRAAAMSRMADERAVDRAVEELARGTGAAGRNSRRLQDGLAHHYYVIVAVGLAAALAVAALGR
jgi:NADH-quinone oxidoreductase subunit L